MDNLITWFCEQQGFLDGESMGLTDFPDNGRGAIALRDIPQGHTLFTIPRQLTLSERTSTLPRLIGEGIWKQFKLDKGWAGLILCMMWEEAQGKDSKWSVYLRSLPTTFNTLMFWSTEDLKELEGTTVVEKIGREDAERDYEHKIIPLLQSRPELFDASMIPIHYSLDAYHIMGSRILSRSFQVEKWEGDGADNANNKEQEQVQKGSDEMDVDVTPVPSSHEVAEEHDAGNDSVEHDEDDEEDDNSSDVAMVPMADMLNARFGSENAKLFHEEKELKMITTKPINAGEQIWNTYGDPPNSDLLRRYGHVDLVPLPDGGEGNPADVVEVPANLIVEAIMDHRQKGTVADNSDLKERIDWWLEEGGDDVFVLEMDYVLPLSFISLVKLLLCSVPDWEKAREKGKPPKPKIDAEVVPIAISALEARLGQYPTSIEVDQKLLKEEINSKALDGMATRKRQAIAVRLGEKRVLNGALTRLKATSEVKGNDVSKGKRKRVTGENEGSEKRGDKEKRNKR